MASSCSATLDQCRSLGLEAGYHTVPLKFSWSGISVDRPNFTKPGCDLPLQGVIVSYDTIEKLERERDEGKITEGELSFEESVTAFLYLTDRVSNKIFVLSIEFGEH